MIIYIIIMEHVKTIDFLIEENKFLKEQLEKVENELIETKNKLNTYQLNSKKYYEKNREKIIERVKEYNATNNYKPIISSEKKKEYNKIAYQKRKEKNENI